VASSRATPLDDNAIDIRAVVTGTRLAVAIGHNGSAFSSGDSSAVARVRDRLHALFEGEATLEMRARDAGGSEITLEVPREQR
jgi:LytS/YehU family sensor histidine kinase